MAKQYEITGDLGYNGFPVSLNYITHLDISALYNPEVVVIFKSLMKRDPKTKEKALNDLLTVSAIDDSTIIAWLKCIQNLPWIILEVFVYCLIKFKPISKIVGGKTYSKYLKSSMPIWLMGMFDTDKSVSSVHIKHYYNHFKEIVPNWIRLGVF